MSAGTKNIIEHVDLLRAGLLVSSFAGAFGALLRETRLTAMLGYLIALEPQRFCDLLGFRGTPSSVAIETIHDRDRSDIVVQTTGGVGVIEAKVTRVNPFQQSLKYPAKWRVLLTEHRPTEKERARKSCLYLRWRDLELCILRDLSKSHQEQVRFVARDLIQYLQEHHMISKRQTAEVYAREINEETTLELFLHGHMYGCKYEASSPVAEALYFAPHFGYNIAEVYPGIHRGISYVASINRVEVVSTFAELVRVTKEIRRATWYRQHSALLAPLRKWSDWKIGRRVTFLYLNEPRLVFNPPVQKENLQKGKGWLSRRTFSFDDLFKAWS